MERQERWTEMCAGTVLGRVVDDENVVLGCAVDGLSFYRIHCIVEPNHIVFHV